MKSKFKVLFMPGTHAATCNHVVIFLIVQLWLWPKADTKIPFNMI